MSDYSPVVQRNCSRRVVNCEEATNVHYQHRPVLSKKEILESATAKFLSGYAAHACWQNGTGTCTKHVGGSCARVHGVMEQAQTEFQFDSASNKRNRGGVV